MAHGGPQSTVSSPTLASPPRPGAPPAPPASSDQAQSKRDLTSWWSKFTRQNTKLEEQRAPPGIFGIPLDESIRYANVAISLFDDNGQSYIYGYVPIVVAKCGVFLKEKATEIEGIFRLAGSERRIKELKIAFDSPERYGKGLDWAGYTVHDAANILRRYLNQLPEPIIPLGFYERFRDPLRNHQQQAVGTQESQQADQGSFDADKAIRSYQGLITELPPLNRQLLLYLLDLLAVFASKSDLNKMTTPNLAAIFQPGILSHPQHDMAPQEYRLSQDVLIFLIENQDSFLIGMHGTAADEQTVRDVQSGYQPKPQSGSPTGTPGRTNTVAGRSPSLSSKGPEAARRFSGIRRNVSTSSGNSRRSSAHGGTASPGGVGSPSWGSGVHRSNTVPSQRHGGASPRYSARDKGSGPPTPGQQLPPALQPVAPAADSGAVTTEPTAASESALEADATPVVMQPQITRASSSEATTPLAAPSSAMLPLESSDRAASSRLLSPDVAPRDASTERTAAAPQGSRNFLDILRKTGAGESDKKERPTRKLQKKRAPGSALSSAHSSAVDLGEDRGDDTSENGAASAVSYSYPEPNAQGIEAHSPAETARPDPVSYYTAQSGLTDVPAPRPFAEALRAHSPGRSVQSLTSATDYSEGDSAVDEGTLGDVSDKAGRKRRWRFSHSAKSRHVHDQDSKLPVSSSLSSVPGSVEEGRRRSNSAAVVVPSSLHTSTSALEDKQRAQPASPSDVLSDSEEKKKGPMSWIKGKIQERKEREAAEKRARSPGGVPQQQQILVDRSRSTDRSMAAVQTSGKETSPVAVVKIATQGGASGPEQTAAAATAATPTSTTAAGALAPSSMPEKTTPPRQPGA